MATKKSVDQILDGAADILEKHGWVVEKCYDHATGGFCALGAIAKAAFPKLPARDVESRAFLAGAKLDGHYEDGTPLSPQHVAAVEFLAWRLGAPKDNLDDAYVYSFNDNLPDQGESRLKSAGKVVTKLRSAAKAYRKQQEKVTK